MLTVQPDNPHGMGELLKAKVCGVMVSNFMVKLTLCALLSTSHEPPNPKPQIRKASCEGNFPAEAD